MEIVSTAIEFVQSPVFGGVMAGLWIISESLASISAIKANSVFQAIQNILVRFKRD
jgi:hypothetical protein